MGSESARPRRVSEVVVVVVRAVEGVGLAAEDADDATDGRCVGMLPLPLCVLGPYRG